MTQPALLTILHISDFHFSKKKHREQGIIVDSMIEDLKRICVGRRRPDVILFTGDLVYAAGIDAHDAAYDFLLDRVSKTTGCSDERIFLAPGNHDLSWSGLEKHAAETHGWRALVGTPSEADAFNKLYETQAFDSAVNDKFADYADLERFLRGDGKSSDRVLSNSFVTVDYIPALNLDLVTFNTAVLSAGGHKSFQKDENLLILPEYAVMEAVKALKPGSLRIFVTHHPFNHMSEKTARYLESEFSKHAHLHLYGHMHDPQPRKTTGLYGELISNQCGAIFTARKEYYNGYSLITVDRGDISCETMIRSFFKERSEFDSGIDIVPGGRWWSSEQARHRFDELASPIDPDLFRLHLKTKALAELRRRESEKGSPWAEHDRFVPPPLKRTYINDSTSDMSKVEVESDVNFSEVVDGSANLILYARAEYGRTTLLHELRYQTMIHSDRVGFPRLPVILGFYDIQYSLQHVKRKVRGSIELVPDETSYDALLALGHVCIIVDDVNFSDIGRMQVLREFVSEYPKNRYVFSSSQSSAIKMGACIDPEMPVRFEFVEIKEFKRGEMRQLLQREERCTDVEDWLDRLQNEFKEIHLPFTAANGSMFIEILSEKYNFSPINRAVLMEQFVESTLRKAAADEVKRETFDYTNKTDLLASVAAWMTQSGNYYPHREDVRQQMKSYVDSRGLKAPLSELLSEFLSARILVEGNDGRVGFRYRGVLEYFVSLRMIADADFKDWILDDTRYLQFIGEIGYYAGKVRNDSNLLKLVSERHRRIFESAIKESGAVDLDDFDGLLLPSEKQKDEIDLLEGVIASKPLTNRQKDKILETDEIDDQDNGPIVAKSSPRDAIDKLGASSYLYANLVKNLELIPDADKRRELSQVWRGWATMLMLSIRHAPSLAKSRRMRVAGALYEIQAPQSMSDSVLLRKMMLLLPHVHIKMLTGALGTEKLERQLTEYTIDDKSDHKVVKLLRAGVISELRLDATPSAISDLVSDLSENMFLLWSLVVHVSELRRMDRIKHDHYLKLMPPMAGAVADLRGGSPKTRSNAKRQQLVTMQKEDVLFTMKRKKEERADKPS